MLILKPIQSPSVSYNPRQHARLLDRDTPANSPHLNPLSGSSGKGSSFIGRNKVITIVGIRDVSTINTFQMLHEIPLMS